jgi:hypothetical protein
LSLVIALVVSACSTNTGPGAVLSVGGTYQTAVTLLESTCQGQAVEQHPTVVIHAPGATALVLSHAGSDYAGTMTSGGAFSTPPVTQVFDGISYEIRIAGTFTRTGIDARVDVLAGRQPPCNFAARWTGPKSGEPNVIP